MDNLPGSGEVAVAEGMHCAGRATLEVGGTGEMSLDPNTDPGVLGREEDRNSCHLGVEGHEAIAANSNHRGLGHPEEDTVAVLVPWGLPSAPLFQKLKIAAKEDWDDVPEEPYNSRSRRKSKAVDAG